MERSGSNGFGFIAPQRRSFERLALEACTWTEDGLWVDPDEDDGPCEPDWFSPTRIDTMEHSFTSRSSALGLGNTLHGWTASRQPALHTLAPTEHVSGLAKDPGSAQELNRVPQTTAAHPTAASSRPMIASPNLPSAARLSQLAHILGRSWARDRRVRMGEGLGGGFRVWRGL